MVQQDIQFGYTLYVYKSDKRVKEGERIVHKEDYPGYSGNAMMDEVKFLRSKYPPAKGYRMDFEDTYVQRQNLMSGAMVWERHDLPYSCRVSSECYWSN